MARTITTETVIDTLNGFDLIHTTDNRKRPTDRYTLRVDKVVAASAHRVGIEGTFSVLIGDAETNCVPPRVVGIAPDRETAIRALRRIATAL